MTAATQTLDREAMDALVTRARREIDSGLLPSCQLAIAQHGEVVLDVTLGDATPDTRYVIFSCTKASSRARSGCSSATTGSIPRRASPRSSRIRRQRKGRRPRRAVAGAHERLSAAPLGPPDWYTREARLARFERWRLTFEPGTKFEYHPTSAHWVLAEVIERLSGTDYREFIRDRILEPLGLTRLALGVPEDQQSDIAPLSGRGEAATPDELEAAIGVRELPVTEVTEAVLLGFNVPANLALGVPGGGAVSTAADFALFYQALLDDPGDVWARDVRLDAIGEIRNRFPDERGVPANRTLGLVVAGDDGQSAGRGMGHTVSPAAFGHNGAGGQIAWADPATGLSFVYLTNGLDRNVLREWRRTSGLASRAARCAG